MSHSAYASPRNRPKKYDIVSVRPEAVLLVMCASRFGAAKKRLQHHSYYAGRNFE
jgi:hypothetical protein